LLWRAGGGIARAVVDEDEVTVLHSEDVAELAPEGRAGGSVVSAEKVVGGGEDVDAVGAERASKGGVIESDGVEVLSKIPSPSTSAMVTPRMATLVFRVSKTIPLPSAPVIPVPEIMTLLLTVPKEMPLAPTSVIAEPEIVTLLLRLPKKMPVPTAFVMVESEMVTPFHGCSRHRR
jgi:hypothetical protein